MPLVTLPMFCRQCGYNLHGLPENRCPECGQAFDPNNPKTYWRHAATLSRRRWAKRIIVALLTLLILSTVAGVSLWYPWHGKQAAVQMVRRYKGYGGGVVHTTAIGLQWLQCLLGNRGGFLLQRVDDIYIINSPVTDTDLASLKELPYLRSVALSGNSKLTDAVLVNLENLKQLQELYLEGAQITQDW